MATDLLGHWGETLAAQYLRKKGYQLVAVNYRCRMGEIDLIVQKKEYLVFVEVKLRKDASFAEALEFVDKKKQNRIKTAAKLYLKQNDAFSYRARFDVIEIYAPQGVETKKPTIHHLEDAFQ
ncbi:MAG: YraN family protein [Oscillospiraceae bacterium]|nr:YraN family protein [Oscillospiraceae bacterium]